MYSNLAGILLNSVPVLPSSASLPELGRVLRIPAGLWPVLQELGGDWKVLIPSGIEGTHAVLNPGAAVGAEGDGEVGVAASWIDGAWGGGEGEMRHGASGVAGTRR